MAMAMAPLDIALRDRVHEYGVVLLYTKESLSVDAARLMRLAGSDRFNSMVQHTTTRHSHFILP